LTTRTNETQDKEIFLNYREAFDRPAFKGKYQFWSEWAYDPDGLSRFQKAITDTVLCLTTGARRTRSGKDLGMGKGKTHIVNPGWRSDVDEVEKLLSAIFEIVDQNKYNPYLIDAGPIDEYRDQIIRILNATWIALDIPPLPIPTTVERHDKLVH
jgi:hypothetical protein